VVNHRPQAYELSESLCSSAIAAKGWSVYGAKRAQLVATDRKRDRPENDSNRRIGNRWHGKEGVNGSSPLESFSEAPAQHLLSLSLRETLRSGGVHETSTAPNVSELAMVQPRSPSGLRGSCGDVHRTSMRRNRVRRRRVGRRRARGCRGRGDHSGGRSSRDSRP